MPCLLTPIEDSPDFNGPATKKVTLVTKDGKVGTVLFKKAEYNGKQLVPDGQTTATISFDVAAGANDLSMVFVFSRGKDGDGELREIAPPDSQHLRDLHGDQPFQLITIHGV
jgi:hypothetical protein